MCCVIPPASVSTTALSRIASRSVVAVVDVAHDRDDRRPAERSSGSSSKVSGSSSSSSACLISTSFFDSVAMSSIASSESVCVMVTISPTPIMILMISGTETPRAAESSLTVAPELTLTGPVCAGARCCAGRSVFCASRCGRSAGRGRAACVSMTTRRLRRPPRAAARPQWSLAVRHGSSLILSYRRAFKPDGMVTVRRSVRANARRASAFSKQEGRRQV